MNEDKEETAIMLIADTITILKSITFHGFLRYEELPLIRKPSATIFERLRYLNYIATKRVEVLTYLESTLQEKQ